MELPGPVLASASPGAARWPVGSGARLAHALLLVALLAMTRIIGFVLLARITGRGDLGVIDGWTFVALLAASVLSLGGVIGLGLVVWGRVSLAELGWRAERLGPDLLKGALGGLACCAIVLLISIAGGASAAETLQGWWEVSLLERLLGILIGVEAALSEETLFRGDLQPTLQRMLGRGAGLLLTALVFAVYHLRFGAWGLLGKTAFGLVFGILRVRTGRLVSPAVAHWISWTVLGFH